MNEPKMFHVNVLAVWCIALTLGAGVLGSMLVGLQTKLDIAESRLSQMDRDVYAIRAGADSTENIERLYSNDRYFREDIDKLVEGERLLAGQVDRLAEGEKLIATHVGTLEGEIGKLYKNDKTLSDGIIEVAKVVDKQGQSTSDAFSKLATLLKLLALIP